MVFSKWKSRQRRCDIAISITSICNMALARIGASRINDYDEASVNAVHCRTHYEQSRDALLRSHWWGFASARAELAQDASDPDFEWDNQFILPADMLLLKSVYEDNNTPALSTIYSFSVEGDRLLTNEDEVSIRYIRRVTDPTEFDALFVEALVLQLAMKLVMPITQDKVLRRDLQDELRLVLLRAKSVDRQEVSRTGSYNRENWNDARASGDRGVTNKSGGV